MAVGVLSEARVSVRAAAQGRGTVVLLHDELLELRCEYAAARAQGLAEFAGAAARALAVVEA